MHHSFTKTRSTRTRSASPSARRGHHPRPTPPRPAPTALPLALNTRLTDQQEAELWAMTQQERIAAMAAGQLSLGQLTAWSRRHSAEVPLIGNELAYIAMHDPEFCEPAGGEVPS